MADCKTSNPNIQKNKLPRFIHRILSLLLGLTLFTLLPSCRKIPEAKLPTSPISTSSQFITTTPTRGILDITSGVNTILPGVTLTEVPKRITAKFIGAFTVTPEVTPTDVPKRISAKYVGAYTVTPGFTEPPKPGKPIAPSVNFLHPNETWITNLRPEFRLNFTQVMEPTSVLTALSIVPSFDFTTQWEGNTLIISPTINLQAGQIYRFDIAMSAASKTGYTLQRAFSFTRGIAPTVMEATFPSATNRNNYIAYHFNYAMDVNSVEQALSIEPEIQAEWKWYEDNKYLTITPQKQLPPEMQYTLIFRGSLRDVIGNNLPSPPPETFTTPNAVVSASPKGGDDDPENQINVVFDRPIDASSVVGALSISPFITGTIEVKDASIIFSPQSGWFDEVTSYDVTISTTVRGKDGLILLKQPFSWSFTTDHFPIGATFGEYGPNAQVLDADGPLPLQFISPEFNSAVRFDLFPMNFSQFLDGYKIGFGDIHTKYNKFTPINTSSLITSCSWEVDTSLEEPLSLVETTIPRMECIGQDIPPGLYLLNMSTVRLDDQMFVVITHNTLAVSQSTGQLVVWVSEINGGYLPGVDLEVYNTAGELLVTGKSDNEGVFVTSLPRTAEPLLVIAKAGEDITLSGLTAEWWGYRRMPWNHIPTQSPPAEVEFAVSIYTDRPIYRPGQVVNYKAIIRQDEDAALSMPVAAWPVRVRIRDARQNIVQTSDLSTNSFGTLNGQFSIDAGAMLGDYSIEVTPGYALGYPADKGKTFKQVFKVQDYTKPDFQATITTDKQEYIEGDPIFIKVAVNYLFGQPVSQASLTLKQYKIAQDYLYSDFQTWNDLGIEELTATSDDNGEYTFVIQANLFDVDYQKETWGYEITADDGSNQYVNAKTKIQITSTRDHISLNVVNQQLMVGQPINLKASLMDAYGLPVANRELFFEIEWNREEYIDVSIALSGTLLTDNQGFAMFDFTPGETGRYHLSVEGVDYAGREIYQWTYFDVPEPSSANPQKYLTISANRERYIVGTTARLSIETNITGPALLTCERGSIRDMQLIYLTSPVTQVYLTIRADYAPNVFVTVKTWVKHNPSIVNEKPDRGAYWYTYEILSGADSQLISDSVKLLVPVTDKNLVVSMTTDQASYLPGAQATFTITVKDQAGLPVKAEVSLAMVDEAIYGLSADPSLPLFDTFYAERQNMVNTYNSFGLSRVLQTQYGGEAGGGGGDYSYHPRRDFLDTAVWLPSLYTNAQGIVSVTVTMPDNLTTWRLTARAITSLDTRVGEIVTWTQTFQPVSIRPFVPKTLTTGDQVVLAALVRNDADLPLELVVDLEVGPKNTTPIIQILQPITQTITLAPGEQRKIEWTANALSAGDTTITISAVPLQTTPITGQAEDAMGDSVQIPITVQAQIFPEILTQVGDFTGSMETEIIWTTDTISSSGVKIELERSIAGTLVKGLEYLTGFPHGCVEQTMDKALPNAVVGRAFHELGILRQDIEAVLPAQINAGVQRLYGFQQTDGGWGWWFDDDTNHYQTAWVVFGLSVTAQAGYEVDPGVIKRGADYLVRHLGEMDAETRAFALYSLAIAGHGDLEITLSALQDLDKLGNFGQAALALAFYEFKASEQANQIMDGLIKTAIINSDLVYWSGKTWDGTYNQKIMASDISTTAMVLRALITIHPGHELEGSVVRWLMGKRVNAGWGSTNETTFTILALTDYIQANEKVSGVTDYRLILNGQLLFEGSLRPDDSSVMLDIPQAQMISGVNRLRFEHSGSGKLYYKIASFVNHQGEQAAAAGKIKMTRTYLADGSLPVDSVQVGDLVQVKITVQVSEDADYVMIEDHLPAGLTAINESLNTTSVYLVNQEEIRYTWQSYGYNFKDVHGDRVVFYITSLHKGTITISYLARAINVGTFITLPAEISAMYDPFTWGRSTTFQFKVEN